MCVILLRQCVSNKKGLCAQIVQNQKFNMALFSGLFRRNLGAKHRVMLQGKSVAGLLRLQHTVHPEARSTFVTAAEIRNFVINSSDPSSQALQTKGLVNITGP